MADELRLQHPWMVAVWPGIGHVAVSAGYYLMAKLEMRLIGELSAADVFDVEHVEVKGGLIQPGRLPQTRLYLWQDPAEKHDIVVLIGEAQPTSGKYALCRRLVEYAQNRGVERLFTFAAMATEMRPGDDSRVFAAATEDEGLSDLKRLELEILEGGHIGGLNGVLLGAAAQAGMKGVCLLGELPHMFPQLPFPKAALAILRVFAGMAEITLDLDELAEQAEAVEQKLVELLAQVEQAMEGPAAEEELYKPQPPGGISPEDEQHIERLFQQAERDRSKAYELKQELDRLDVFKAYEDRFLDLFKSP